jgi:hypothetical protein
MNSAKLRVCSHNREQHKHIVEYGRDVCELKIQRWLLYISIPLTDYSLDWISETLKLMLSPCRHMESEREENLNRQSMCMMLIDVVLL